MFTLLPTTNNTYMIDANKNIHYKPMLKKATLDISSSFSFGMNTLIIKLISGNNIKTIK